MSFWKKIKGYFMFIILIASIVGLIFLFNFWQELRKDKPNLEVNSVKFFGLIILTYILLWLGFHSLIHVKDIFKAQSIVEKDLFAYEKQYQAKERILELQNKLAQTEHKNTSNELQRQIELKQQIEFKKQLQSEEKTTEKTLEQLQEEYDQLTSKKTK